MPSRLSLNLTLDLDACYETDISQITDYLYLGSQQTSMDWGCLKAKGITHIINATPSQPNYFEGSMKYLRVSLADNTEEDLRQHMQSTYAFIEEARRTGGACLVHCFAGVSRSASIVLSYLLLSRRLPILEGLTLLRQARPQVSPNHGFMSQLLSVERILCHGATLDLEKYREDRFCSLDCLRV